MTTDPRAVAALLPYLKRDGVARFAEPCAGARDLSSALVLAGLNCRVANDISWEDGKDALTMDFLTLHSIDAIITNPPWTRQILHPMIVHFCSQAPTWLLFDSDWAYNQKSYALLTMCTDIVPTPRLKWIEGTKHTAKDNTSWYRFDAHHTGPTVFHGRA
jgi:hypothetical protein